MTLSACMAIRCPAGAVHVLDRVGVPMGHASAAGGTQVGQWGARAVLCELAWGQEDMEVGARVLLW
jgi:hypothetical protein